MKTKITFIKSSAADMNTKSAQDKQNFFLTLEKENTEMSSFDNVDLDNLDRATQHINISYDCIKSLNSENKNYNTLKYYLKMSLLLLERAGFALRDSLDVEKESLLSAKKIKASER